MASEARYQLWSKGCANWGFVGALEIPTIPRRIHMVRDFKEHFVWMTILPLADERYIEPIPLSTGPLTGWENLALNFGGPV